MNEPVILIVDDDPQVLSALRRDLRSRYREEFRIQIAGSGEVAVDTMKKLKARADALAMAVREQLMRWQSG